LNRKSSKLYFANSYEKSICIGKDNSSHVPYLGFDPMPSVFAADHSSLDTDGRAGGHGTQIFHLHLTGYRRYSPGAIRFAHRLIENGRDDASMQAAVRSFIVVGDDGICDDRPFRSSEELKLEANCICRAASEAAVLRSAKE
jgi:hypothetical protein